MFFTKEDATLEMRYLGWIVGASWISVKFKCEYDIQWEAPEQSRD